MLQVFVKEIVSGKITVFDIDSFEDVPNDEIKQVLAYYVKKYSTPYRVRSLNYVASLDLNVLQESTQPIFSYIRDINTVRSMRKV